MSDITENDFWGALNEPDPEIKYLGDNIMSKTWKNEEGVIHRETWPAIIHYYSNGNVWIKIWHHYGKRHRINGPAVIWYSSDGKTKVKELFFIDDHEFDKEVYWTIVKEPNISKENND